MNENKRKGLFNTRRQSICPIFGDPCDFSENQLPSNNAVMKCYLLVRNEMKRRKIIPRLSLRQRWLKNSSNLQKSFYSMCYEEEFDS